MSDNFCPAHSSHNFQLENNSKRLDAHSKTLDALTESLIELKEIEKQNAQTLARMDERVSKLEEKPRERWEMITGYIAAAVIGVLVGFIAVSLGIN